MLLSGAEILIKSLLKEGVDTIFGYPGGAVLPIYDVLYKTPEITHIRTCHEQAAAHAADGYARVTGKVGVCLSTSGPGATNLVTGIANAYMDSVPMVAITGQVPLALLGKDSFQEVDITGITLPITKHNFIVKDVKKIRSVVREAFRIASTGRPGPVLIDMPKDIQMNKTEFDESIDYDMPLRKDTNYNFRNHIQIEKAVEFIAKARCPVIYAGGGVVISGGNQELLEFAEKARIPVTTTLMALGAVPSEHPLSLGMLGMHGTAYANYAVSNADLLIAVGARFDDRVVGNVEKFAPKAKIIHIDIDPAEIGKNIEVDIPITGDVKEVLQAINKYLKDCKNDIQREDWINQIENWKKKYPLKYCKNGSLKPQYIIQKVYDVTEGEAIITTEVGQHQMWTAQYYKFKKPRTFVTSGGLGTMGFGFPAAIGAQIGCPNKRVIVIAGDGSFKMNSSEIETIVNYNLPLVVLILNNSTLGMVRQWQDLFYEKRYSYVDFHRGPDFVKLAESYGALGMRIKKPEEVEETIYKALVSNKPVIIDCIIDAEEKVFPMVPAGSPINSMIGV